MESTPAERYHVMRKITIAVVIQAVYVFFTFHYVPIPESIRFTVKPENTYCVPIRTLQNGGNVIPGSGDMGGDVCIPLVRMGDDSMDNKHCMPLTGFQKDPKINHYTAQGENDEDVSEQYCVRFPGQASISMLDRCFYTLRWQLLSASTLLFAIIDVALRRLHTKALDPINGQAEHLVQVKVRICQNTAEQLICNVIGQLVLCTYLTEKSMKIIPILVSLFVLGRVIFKIGYERSPSRRTHGFAFTYIPTAATFLYCAWCAVYTL